MSVWSVPAFLDALEEALAERDAFAGAEIHMAPPGEMPNKDNITIFGVRGEKEDGTFGPNNDERYTVIGMAWAVAKGKGREKWTDARQRAYDLFEDLGVYLAANPTVPDGDGTGTVGYARMGTFDFLQGVLDGARVCRIDFEIEVTALS